MPLILKAHVIYEELSCYKKNCILDGLTKQKHDGRSIVLARVGGMKRVIKYLKVVTKTVDISNISN